MVDRDLDRVADSLYRMYKLGYSEGKSGKKAMTKEMIKTRMKLMSKFVK